MNSSITRTSTRPVGMTTSESNASALVLVAAALGARCGAPSAGRVPGRAVRLVISWSLPEARHCAFAGVAPVCSRCSAATCPSLQDSHCNARTDRGDSARVGQRGFQHLRAVLRGRLLWAFLAGHDCTVVSYGACVPKPSDFHSISCSASWPHREEQVRRVRPRRRRPGDRRYRKRPQSSPLVQALLVEERDPLRDALIADLPHPRLVRWPAGREDVGAKHRGRTRSSGRPAGCRE